MDFSSITERFWNKVNKTDGCWIWTANKCWGYGLIKWQGRSVRAHRLSWQMHYGEIPEGMSVLHNCYPAPDNRACVNPAHLWLGTHQDNMDDMIAKDRKAMGEQHPMAMVSEVDVLAMRERYATKKWKMRELAEEYDISYNTARDILKGRYWKRVGGPISPRSPNQRGSNSGSAKLKDADFTVIRDLYERHSKNQYELAEMFHVSQTHIWRIVHRIQVTR